MLSDSNHAKIKLYAFLHSIYENAKLTGMCNHNLSAILTHIVIFAAAAAH